MSSKAAPRQLKFLSLVFRTAVGAAVLGLGIGIAWALVATKPELPPREMEASALVVGTVPATRVDVARVWAGYGTARAMRAANVAAEVGGLVVERPDSVEAGSPVGAGDLLVQIERTDYLARVRAAEQAEAQGEADLAGLEVDEAAWREQLELAEEQAAIERRELSQALRALEQGAASVSEIDQRTKALRALESQASSMRQQLGRVPSRRAALRASLDRLRAETEVARRNLERTSVASPIGGVLERVEVDRGEVVGAGAPVARVVDVSRVEVPVRVGASALGSVRIGDRATLRPDGPSGASWSGVVGRISPEVDPATRSVTVFVEVEQDPSSLRSGEASGLLLPGRFVVAEIEGATEAGLLLVPRRAVRDGVVFLARREDGGRWLARRTPVRSLFHTRGRHPEIDALEDQWTALEAEGIPEGAPIIVTNLDAMADGVSIGVSTRAADGGSR
jgi:multidrug resistance efflux pump